MKVPVYKYDWRGKFDRDLMKDFNWFLYKINQRACIEQGFITEEYEAINRHGDKDFGLGIEVEYFHPTITLDDRMRFIGTTIAQSGMSTFNIIANTFISHFYGARGVHYLASGSDVDLVDFDRVADGDDEYIKFLDTNLQTAKKNKQPIWGTTELHTSIQASSRNFCREKYNDPDRVFRASNVIEWVASFRENGIFERMMKIDHIRDMYNLMKEQPGIGEYYGFHSAASTSVLPQVKYHHDQRFVSPGPGARRAIRRLWANAPMKVFDDAIYFLRERSDEVGLTNNVVFHPAAYNIENIFVENQDTLKYYGTEVLCCQFGVYLDIRDDESKCGRRKVARAVQSNSKPLTEFM